MFWHSFPLEISIFEIACLDRGATSLLTQMSSLAVTSILLRSTDVVALGQHDREEELIQKNPFYSEELVKHKKGILISMTSKQGRVIHYLIIQS